MDRSDDIDYCLVELGDIPNRRCHASDIVCLGLLVGGKSVVVGVIDRLLLPIFLSVWMTLWIHLTLTILCTVVAILSESDVRLGGVAE
jgi:hypothetical protein